MPKISGKSAFGAVGTVRNFMSVVKEINFDEVRDRAEQVPKVLVLSTDDGAARDAVGRLFGDQVERYVETRVWSDSERTDVSRYDAVVVADPGNTSLLERVRKSSGRSGSENIFFLPNIPGRTTDGEEPLRNAMVSALPDLAPSFGRFFPVFRAAAVKAIVDETARANAQFALVSNIPAIVPILGSFVAAGADLIVLTKNQVMMSYKIAAAHGRDLHDQAGVIRELAPVVGAGFLWRSIAREATSFLPLAAGTIPKVAIAYMGTFSVGRTIDYYYRFGKKPSKDQLQQFAKQASELAAKIDLPGRKDQPSPNGHQGGAVDAKQRDASIEGGS